MTVADLSVTAVDQLAIGDLYHRFNWSLDNRDGLAFSECFAPGGELIHDQLHIVGLKALRELVAQPTEIEWKTRHWTGNLLVVREPAGVLGASYGLRIDVAKEGAPAIGATTVTSDRLVVHLDRWKFIRRHIRSD